MVFHCLFEQSGTFKNVFKKLGFKSYDYDILNDFNETDYVCDLFKEIKQAYNNEVSIFDNFSKDDLILAFFPCTRFENQILLWFKGNECHLRNKSLIEKMEKDIELHCELNLLYNLICKLVIVAMRKNLKLIIENPYSEQHYLIRYWALKPLIIDYDRTLKGDYFKKPTAYFFVNFEPKCNLVFECVDIKPKKTISHVGNKVERSMISKEYAERFIKEFIL